MSDWAEWFHWGGDEEETDGAPDPDEEEGDSIDTLRDTARQCVEDYRVRYNPGGEEDVDADYGLLSGSYSLKAAILSAVRTLERLVERCGDWQLRDRYGTDFTTEKVYSQRIETLMSALDQANEAVHTLRSAEERLRARWQAGQVDQQGFDDEYHRLCNRQQRTITRLEMAEAGGTYGDIGEVGDITSHIIEDGLLADGGEMRRRIGEKLWSMPRDRALDIIAQAVEDGRISQSTADHLIREYVRTK